MSISNRVIELIESFLVRRNAPIIGISMETSLYQDGLGMDSLDAAEFSVLLETAFGSDPYSDGEFPRTVGDVIRFCEQQVKESSR